MRWNASCRTPNTLRGAHCNTLPSATCPTLPTARTLPKKNWMSCPTDCMLTWSKIQWLTVCANAENRWRQHKGRAGQPGVYQQAPVHRAHGSRAHAYLFPIPSQRLTQNVVCEAWNSEAPFCAAVRAGHGYPAAATVPSIVHHARVRFATCAKNALNACGVAGVCDSREA